MQEQFVDRVLKCADCSTDFIFTAGEQLFFFDKQFKNDPKRCKPCKSRRSGLAAAANGQGVPKAGMLRTETRTQCSDCGIETTVPFKPTQGRPVLCRQCFGRKSTVLPAMPEPSAQALLLAEVSMEGSGAMLSHDAALLAVTSMALAGSQSCVASEADLAYVAGLQLADESSLAQVLLPQTSLELLQMMDAASPETSNRLQREPSQA